jgi:hypothetical protein
MITKVHGIKRKFKPWRVVMTIYTYLNKPHLT